MIRQMRRFVPIVVAAVAGCNAPAGNTLPVTEIPAGAVNVAWNDAVAVRISHASYSGFRQAARTVIDNDADWRAAWATYSSGDGSTRPAVDFTRYDVILAALGQRTTGGYGITVSRIAATSDYLYVEITSTSPGSRCITTQALTQPADIVRIPRQHPPVVFVEKSVVVEC